MAKRSTEDSKTRSKRYKLRSRYGIKLETWQAMLAHYDRKCPGCQRKVKNPQVEHCHSTGRVTMLSCVQCNWILAACRRSAETLRRLADILDSGLDWRDHDSNQD